MAGFSVGGGLSVSPPGSAGSPSGGISGTTTAGGAQTASYGRASTIAAPILRDIVSLNDYGTSTNGNGTTDDTTIVGTAVAALNAKGGGTFLIPPLNKAGNQALWTFQRVSMNGTANITVSAYGARAQFVSNSAGGSMFKGDGSATNPGSYNISQFKLFGLTVVGTGNENALNQSVVQFDRSTDTTIRDTFVSLWNGAVYFFFDAARTRIEDNTLIQCSHGGANPINISIEISSLGWSTLLNDAYVVGNTVTACHTAPVAISCGSPSPTSTLTLGVVWTGTAPTGGGTDIAFTQNQWVTGTLNATTAVTGIAPNQSTGVVFNVTGTNVPAATTLTITGATTGTLSNAATGSGSTTLTLTASFATTGTAIAFNATAAQVQTAIQAAITAGGGPASAVTCYGGPLGQCWSGTTPPNPPVVIVFGTSFQGLLTNLATTDAYTGGTGPASVFSYPRIMLKVQNNTLESDNLAALDIEFGGQASGGGTNGEFYHDGIVTGNFLTYTGGNSGSAAALVLSADSTPSIARGDLYRRWQIADNNIYSNHDGALLNGYDITFQSNTVRAGQYGVKVQPSSGGSANPCSNVHVKGGVIRMIDAGIAGAAAVLFNAVTDGTIDVPVYYDTGATGTSDGITLTNCTRVDVRAKIANAPRHGLHLTSCGDCHIEPGTRITNPSSNSTTATGITIDGTLTDNLHIDGVDIRDNRGIPTMKYGVDTSTATLNGFGVYERNGRILGWVTSALHGTFALGGLNDLWDTTGVVWTAGKRVTWVANAAPVSGTWGVGDIAWNLAPAAGGTSFWMCTTAGTPGTWTAQVFTPPAAVAQGAVVAKGANYTMLVTDSTVKTTASAITITLPTAGLGSSVGMLTWQVKNASTGNVTVSTGTAGIIDNFTGGNLQTTYTVIAGDAAVFQLDTNSVDWLLV